MEEKHWLRIDWPMLSSSGSDLR